MIKIFVWSNLQYGFMESFIYITFAAKNLDENWWKMSIPLAKFIAWLDYVLTFPKVLAKWEKE